MTRIAVSDLWSSHEEKFIDTISAGETKHVYAGMKRMFGPDIYPDESRTVAPAGPAATADSLNNQNWSIDQWMDRLELQLGELRGQLGKRWT